MPDPYANPDAQSEASLQVMITRLEERGRFPAFARMIRKYGQSLPSDRPLKVLDVGCGTGVVIRELAGVLHPASTFHGADVSAGLLKEARKRAPHLRAEWDQIAPGSLPYADGAFDVVTMHTLLSHVPDPAQLLREAKRVLAPDGRLIVFDVDHAGTTYQQPDYARTRRFDQLIAAAISTHPDICRQLPRLLQGGGYELTQHEAEVISECGKGDYWLSSVRSVARLLPTLGVLSAEETESWTRHMLRSHEDGTFFAATAFYTFYARAIRR